MFFGRVTMVTVVTVFLGAGSDAKDRHASGGRGRDGLRHDDTTPQNIVTIVTTVTPDRADSSFGANRCQVTAQKPQSESGSQGKKAGRKTGQQFAAFSLSGDSKKRRI